MKIKIEQHELVQRSQQALQKLLSSQAFSNPKFLDGEFTAHGKKQHRDTYPVSQIVSANAKAVNTK